MRSIGAANERWPIHLSGCTPLRIASSTLVRAAVEVTIRHVITNVAHRPREALGPCERE